MILLTFDPKFLSARDAYKLLIEAVVPRPIAFVSLQSELGVRNLAPFSFFTVVKQPRVAESPLHLEYVLKQVVDVSANRWAEVS